MFQNINSDNDEDNNDNAESESQGDVQTRKPRGKTVLPPRPSVPVSRTEKKQHKEAIINKNEEIKKKGQGTIQKRIAIRAQRHIEREKKEPPAKRLRSRTTRQYLNKT